MRKIPAIAFSIALCFCLIGCAGQPTDETKDAPSTSDADNSTSQKSTEPLNLDGEISGNGLTVKYPSSWGWREGKTKEIAYIDPPCGGIVSVNSYSKMSESITPETSDSVIDSFAKEYFDGMEGSDALQMSITGEYEKRVDGDAVIITAPLEYESKGVKYVGVVYIGRIGYQLCSITTGVPSDADEQYKKTVNAIVDNAKYVKTDKSEPEAKTDDPATDKEETPAPSKPTATVSQQNARSKALQYLDYTAFSYTGLIEQLEYEGFSTEDATYGADNCGADWNKQAAKKAQDYLDYTSFSRDGLIDQLVYEGFTYDQAVYGVDSVGL